MRRGRSRFAGSLCLLTFLSGQVQMLPLLLALAATSDISHSVCVGLDQGKFTLVLRHQAGQPRLADYKPQCDSANPAHRHGLIAQYICALSTSNDQAPDHVACFASSVAAAQPQGDSSSKIQNREFPVERNVCMAGSKHSVEGASSPEHRAHAPPVTWPTAVYLRSVSLLI